MLAESQTLKLVRLMPTVLRSPGSQARAGASPCFS